MTDFIAMLWFIIFAAMMASVTYDVLTYAQRQAKWETLHPGQNYIRGYRKLRAKHPQAFS